MSFPLQLQTVQLPGTAIELFVPDALAVKEAFQKGEIPFPYWSQVWPAAKALAGFLVQNSACTYGKTVVELGAGLGLPSLIAARNAHHVLCTDLEAEAVAIARQSAVHLQLKNFAAAAMDWQHLLPGLQADVLLLSDTNYEPAAFAALQAVIAAFLQKGTVVLLSTPQRLPARAFVAPLLAHCARQEERRVPHSGNDVSITVMVLRSS